MTAIKRLPDVPLGLARLQARRGRAWLCLVGDGPDREPRRAAGTSSWHRPGSTISLGYQRDVAPYYGLFDAAAASGNEGRRWWRSKAGRRHARGSYTHVGGGVPDVVEDGTAGFRRGRRRREALARARAAFARDPSQAAMAGQGASERSPLPGRAPVDDGRPYRELVGPRLRSPRATDASFGFAAACRFASARSYV